MYRLEIANGLNPISFLGIALTLILLVRWSNASLNSVAEDDSDHSRRLRFGRICGFQLHRTAYRNDAILNENLDKPTVGSLSIVSLWEIDQAECLSWLNCHLIEKSGKAESPWQEEPPRAGRLLWHCWFLCLHAPNVRRLFGRFWFLLKAANFKFLCINRTPLLPSEDKCTRSNLHSWLTVKGFDPKNESIHAISLRSVRCIDAPCQQDPSLLYICNRSRFAENNEKRDVYRFGISLPLWTVRAEDFSCSTKEWAPKYVRLSLRKVSQISRQCLYFLSES